jgi:hypothetical protein
MGAFCWKGAVQGTGGIVKRASEAPEWRGGLLWGLYETEVTSLRGPLKQIIPGVLLLLLPVGTCAAEGLFGVERNGFVKASYESCMKSQTADPANSSLPVEKLDQYCTCFANRLADNTQPNELKDLNAQTLRDPAAMVIKLKPLVKVIGDHCAETVFN